MASRRAREIAALLGAFALHGAAFMGASRPARISGPAASDMIEPVDIDIEPARPATEAPPTAALEPERPPRSHWLGFAVRSAAEVPTTEASPPAESPASSPGAPPDLVPPPRLSLDQLGLAGRNIFLAGSADKSSVPSPGAPAERNEAPGVDLSIRDALIEHDHAAGLDGSGAVVGIAEDVARQNDAPLNSRAVFELAVDSRGEITSVHVVDASGGRGTWEQIAAGLVSTLRARRPVLRRGPPMLVTLEITSQWRLPSGDAPGGPVQADHGGLSFDVTDIGARPLRVVHARIMREKAQR